MIIEYYEAAIKNIRKHTSKRLVRSFEEYLIENKVPSHDWYHAIDSFMETQKYSKKTKYTYSNTLRNYIENINHIQVEEEVIC